MKKYILAVLTVESHQGMARRGEELPVGCLIKFTCTDSEMHKTIQSIMQKSYPEFVSCSTEQFSNTDIMYETTYQQRSVENPESRNEWRKRTREAKW